MSQAARDRSPNAASGVSERFAALLAIATEVADRCSARAATTDAIGFFPEIEFNWLRHSGLLLAPLDAEHGGAGFLELPGGWISLLRILAQIGRGSLPVGRIYEGHVNALQLIARFGSRAQRDRWAADAANGHYFAVWNAEDRAGLSLSPAGGGGFRLDGAKTFCSGAGRITRPIVPATLKDGRGLLMCIVPMDEVRVDIDRDWWQPLGMAASVSSRIDFTGVEVSVDDVLGGPNDYLRQPDFSGGAIRFAAVHAGGAEALVDAVREFVRGDRRSEDPHQRARVARLAIMVESCRLWLTGAAQLAERWQDEPDAAVAHACMTRLAIEELCLEALRLADRTVGARGLIEPQPFARLHRDLTMYLRQPNPDGALAKVGTHVLSSAEPFRELWPHER